MSSPNQTLATLKENKINKEHLNSFYQAMDLFDDNFEELAIAMILIRKHINSAERPNVIYKKAEEGKYSLLFEYCEYILDLPMQELKKLKELINLKREKILNKIFTNKVTFPVFKKDSQGNIYKFEDEEDCEVVFIKDDKTIRDDYKCYDKGLETIHCDKERGLYNNQPVWCWNNGIKEKQLRFYNSFTKTAYSCYNYSLFDFGFDNYEALNLTQIRALDFLMEI